MLNMDVEQKWTSNAEQGGGEGAESEFGRTNMFYCFSAMYRSFIHESE